MLNTLSTVVYKVFGLNVVSDIFLPELIQISDQIEKVDVRILIEDLTKSWSESEKTHGDFIVKENLVMFQIPSIATFSIEDGNKIIVSPLAGSIEGEIRLFILGTCMGVILQQKKILPLHGSAIEIDGRAYAFIGNSGAGKSTLASAFLNNGYRLLTDDVIAISLSQEDIPFVTPSYPQQKLWQESLNEFGMDHQKYHPLFERETKYAIPVHSQFSTDTIPLGGIFELVKSNNEETEIHVLNGLERLHTMFYHTYRNFMIAPSGLMNWHFNTSAQIVRKINFFQIRRPSSYFTAHDLPAYILKTLKIEFES
ncbi:aldolase [Neobacillus sp. OS1-33]|uniref:aldolase n=1 Tax=Neobacillus sp. OS1-33 TaxID=3070683 RepID=UPI0027E1B0B7|nr:aldolase [Neobacillus sp. OS1-33]WML25171.1 aldolase [Neobacillus sp. OS1-33]